MNKWTCNLFQNIAFLYFKCLITIIKFNKQEKVTFNTFNLRILHFFLQKFNIFKYHNFQVNITLITGGYAKLPWQGLWEFTAARVRFSRVGVQLPTGEYIFNVQIYMLFL